jgi:hypothetical protein
MEEVFDRITWRCPVCSGAGMLVAAWLSLTTVMLEATCTCCGIEAVRRFDLLAVDGWLKNELLADRLTVVSL